MTVEELEQLVDERFPKLSEEWVFAPAYGDRRLLKAVFADAVEVVYQRTTGRGWEYLRIPIPAAFTAGQAANVLEAYRVGCTG